MPKDLNNSKIFLKQIYRIPFDVALTYLSLIFTTFCWGGTFIAGRILGETTSPINSAFYRFAIATIVLLFLIKVIEGRISIPPKKTWLKLLFLGLTGVFSYNILFFEGLKQIEAGRASLLIALNPLAITASAVILFGEKLTVKQCLGVVVSLGGAVFVITNGHPSTIFTGGFGLGELAILGCVASWTAYSITGRSVVGTISPIAAVFYSSLIGTLLLLPFALADDCFTAASHFRSREWVSLLFLGVLGTAVGFTLYYLAIRKIGASRASVFINLVPLFSIILSILLLGETLKKSVLIGGAILLFGVYLTNRPASSNR